MVAVAALPITHTNEDQRGWKIVGRGLPLQTRRELLGQMVPCYRRASSAEKRRLLDEFTHITGYHRKYAMWLLNHTEEGQQAPVQSRAHCQYRSEVQEALVQVWNAANRVCTKRLMPFLPTLVEAMERHGSLHLSESCRDQLLRMSPATADRLLRVHRGRGPHGLSTTRAGTLLKQHIPIRTFEQWNEIQPGFLEADLVAHCGSRTEGCFLYTLTLTDIATGWTECLPLLSKSQECVLEAFQQARELFPFPIVGLDTDNGKEFVNELLLRYCEQEQITFTRGRPSLKNDQCFVEQKNGAIVRQVVGYERFVGKQAYRQLLEVYRALRLYSNWFQPSMKLQAKESDGKHVRFVYDQAKTPLQRLLHTQVLSASKGQELKSMAQALDPVRLLQQVERLQQALFEGMTSFSASEKANAAAPLVLFRVEDCSTGLRSAVSLSLEPASGLWRESDLPPSIQSLLDWPRTRHDPFKENWERIASWVLASPERTSREIFRELQQLFPERYSPSHLRTLQRGIRKIRERLLATRVAPWQEEALQRGVTDPVLLDQVAQERDPYAKTAVQAHPVSHVQEQVDAPSFLPPIDPEEEATHLQETKTQSISQSPTAISPGEKSCEELPQARQTPVAIECQKASCQSDSIMTIERAIQEYLQDQRSCRRRPKTLEWHQTALGHFQRYLLTVSHCVLLHQITVTEIESWLAFLRQTPMSMGSKRSAGTVASYARSVRAFCQWLTLHQYLEHTPFVPTLLPKGSPSLVHLLEPEEWDRLLLACHPFGIRDASAEQAAARNRAILWVLMETGMHVSELCVLRLGDVDRVQGRVRVRGKGSRHRQLAMGQDGMHALLRYLDEYRLAPVACGGRGEGSEDHLFLSEAGHPLTENGIALLFRRLRKRAGITRKQVGPSLLRDTFAVRYLQAGGDLYMLRELLGKEESARVKRTLRMIE